MLTIKLLKRPVVNQQGSALLLVLIMLAALLGSAGWMGLQTRTETEIATAIKDYSKSFNAADGSWWLSLFYLREVDRGAEFSSGTPKKDGSEIAIHSDYRKFINKGAMQDVVNTTDNIQTMGKVILVRTLDTVLEGHGISSSGYKAPVTVWYRLVGEGKLKFDLSDGTSVDRSATKMSAIVLRVQ